MLCLCPSRARLIRRPHQVLDGQRLDAIVERTVVQRFDHRDLNQDKAFANQTTTGENLVLLMWDLLVNEIPGGRLAKVGVIETRDNYFEYSGSAAGCGKNMRSGMAKVVTGARARRTRSSSQDEAFSPIRTRSRRW